MKNTIYVISAIILLAISGNTFAQKLDRENLGDYKYVQLPINTVLINYNKYSVQGIQSDPYRRDAIAPHISIAGFDKVSSNSEKDFIVKVEEYPFSYEDREQKTTTEKYKVDGIEKTRTLYYYQRVVSCKYVLRIYTNSGDNIFEYAMPAGKNVVGSKNESSSKALDSFNKAMKNYKASIIKSEVTKICSVVNEEIGYPVKTVALKTALIKPKKYTYEDYDAAFESFKKGVEVIKADEEAVEASAEHFNAGIAAFEKILEESDVENKKARINKKVSAVCYLNIALSYAMMKDYDKSIEYFTKGRELDKDFGAMDTGVRAVEKRKKRLEANIKASES